MKHLLTVFLMLLSVEVLALDAVVTVLETPLFRQRSKSSEVVQYKRKGDVIKIHPSVGNSKRYDHMAPSEEKRKLILTEIAEEADPLFTEPAEEASADDEFIPVVDRMGSKAYVLSEHLYIYFEDARELNQLELVRDPTDYRLKEPLPKNYPLSVPNNYRGQLLVGATQPYTESYPYRVNARAKGYSNPIDLNFAYMKRVSYDTQDRFYFGAIFNMRQYKNEFVFTDDKRATEKGLRLGLGPIAAYDAYKGLKDRINIGAALMIYPYQSLTISQSSPEAQDERVYKAYTVTPKVHLQYHRKNIVDVDGLDFVFGSSVDFELPTTYRAQGGATQDWWQNPGTDNYTTRGIVTMAVYLGVQSVY